MKYLENQHVFSQDGRSMKRRFSLTRKRESKRKKKWVDPPVAPFHSSSDENLGIWPAIKTSIDGDDASSRSIAPESIRVTSERKSASLRIALNSPNRGSKGNSLRKHLAEFNDLDPPVDDYIPDNPYQYQTLEFQNSRWVENAPTIE